MPSLPLAQARALLPHLNKAMEQAGIDTPKRVAAFLAQLAHESGELRYFEELASGAAYEGRRDLGNTQPGDGQRFKGRGPIQLTGRANYAAASKALGIDLLSKPELAARPDVGFRIAAWYWQSRGLNALADSGKFNEITQRINGGQNGASDRRWHFALASQALGAGLAGGPLATESTPIPTVDSRRAGWALASGSRRADADAGFGRLSDSYAYLSGLKQDLFFQNLLLLMSSGNHSGLMMNPALAAFAKANGIALVKGSPVPKELIAEFLAKSLADELKKGSRPEQAVQAISERYALNVGPAQGS